MDELISITDQTGNIDTTVFLQLILRRKNSPQCAVNLPKDLV
jgi:hypothetical protein